jgi:primosomal protein N' (replication factor Y)
MATHTVVKVLLPLPKIGMLDYTLPEHITYKEGKLVKVPFRQTQVVGVIYSLSENCNIPIEKIKPITEEITSEPINVTNLKFINWAANYNLSATGDMARMMLPIPACFTPRGIKNYGKLPPTDPKYSLPTLSVDQEGAVSEILSYQNQHKVILLEGVTGSGKTEVYFNAIAKVLASQEDAQVLILLPEIALTSQVVQRFTDRFGFNPVEWHSDVAPKLKKEWWWQIVHGKAKLIIGARSALFLPYQNLRLIVVDEEHETSYKQEDMVVYHARDMAIARCHLSNIPTLLSSATPSLETINNCLKGKYTKILLHSRFGKAVLPEISIIDMRQSKQQKNEWISHVLRKELLQNFANHKQSMLFLNRRGYAPLTICRSCGHRFGCPSCSSWLVEHRKLHKLVCHYCGYNIHTPDSCSECNTEHSLTACGPGVERIVEELHSIIPNARIALMTRDTADNKQTIDQLLADILNNNIDIIVGTQMVAKGHHFPNLVLVGVIDTDIGLMGGDLRAAEHTYQILHQVSGRAGRVAEKGKVILQSYNPDNLLIKAVQKFDNSSFIKQELYMRKQANMPPFTKLASVIISDKNEDRVREFGRKLVNNMPSGYDNIIDVLGPAPAMISRIGGYYRYRILIRSHGLLQDFIRTWLSIHKKPSSTRLKVDIDPYNFF